MALAFLVLALIPLWELFIVRGAWDQPMLLVLPALPLGICAVLVILARTVLTLRFREDYVLVQRRFFIVPGRVQQFDRAAVHHLEIQEEELVGMLRIAGFVGLHHCTVLLHMLVGAPALLAEFKGLGGGDRARRDAERIAEFLGRSLEVTQNSAPDPVRRIVETAGLGASRKP